jgi:hypothetical protein
MAHITTWEEDYKGNNTSPSLQSPIVNSSSPGCNYERIFWTRSKQPWKVCFHPITRRKNVSLWAWWERARDLSARAATDHDRLNERSETILRCERKKQEIGKDLRPNNISVVTSKRMQNVQPETESNGLLERFDSMSLTHTAVSGLKTCLVWEISSSHGGEYEDLSSGMFCRVK